MYIIFTILTVIVTVLTVLPISRFEKWWIRGWDFPRLQLFVIILILLTLELLLLDSGLLRTWILVSVLLLCLIYQAWWIVPYTRFFKVEVKRSDSIEDRQNLKIITANVLMTNRKAKAFIALIEENQPDILVTLESDQWWQDQLDSLEIDYPYIIKCPLDNFYGMHVYSKLPMKNYQIEFLVEEDKPSIHTLVILPSGHIVRVHFLHPAPPSPTENDESSERDAELIVVAKSVADSEMPIIVTGDLNDVAWSRTTRLFRKISGLLDPRVGRGMFNTFHADYWFMRWPLDHLFHSKHFTLNCIRRLRSFGSDHFALYTELTYDHGQNDHNSGLDADAEDIVWAKIKTSSQNVEKSDVPQPEKLSV